MCNVYMFLDHYTLNAAGRTALCVLYMDSLRSIRAARLQIWTHANRIASATARLENSTQSPSVVSRALIVYSRTQTAQPNEYSYTRNTVCIIIIIIILPSTNKRASERRGPYSTTAQPQQTNGNGTGLCVDLWWRTAERYIKRDTASSSPSPVMVLRCRRAHEARLQDATTKPPRSIHLSLP